MKAIRVHQFGDPGVMKIEEVPTPQPGPGEVLVRAKAIGVNPVDTYIRAGRYGERPFPYTPGMDAAGVIEWVGAGVKSVKPADRIYVYGSLTGTYADLILCREGQVQPLAKNLTFSQGAGVGVPYATAYYALFRRGQAQRGESVLIHGATGGVGTAAIQIAKSFGLVVIGTGGTPQGRELALKEGAHHVLDHHAPDYMDQVMKLTNGRGVDLVLEMLANVNLGKDLKVLARSGRVVVIGSRGSVEIDPRDTMAKHSDIRGMALLTVEERELAEIHSEIVKGLQNGSLRPIVGKEIPLGQAAKAHEEILKPGAYGKIVLIP
jgi:NADPH:quinone reductase